MNTRKATLVMLFLFLICAVIIGSAFAQTSVTVGVSQGDSFRYDLRYLWSSTSSADIAPPSWAIKNQSEYFQVNVDAAAGISLRLSTIWRFTNGTEFTGIEIQEVGNNTSTGFIYIYAANLSSGGYLFPLATDLPFVINNTVFRTYSDTEFRATNHIEVNRTDLPDRVYSYMDLYFDKNTGVLVEATLKEAYPEQPRQTYTTKITLKESSLWNVGNIPTTSISPSITSTSQSTSSPAPTQDTETPGAESFDTLLIVLVIIFVIIIIIIIFIVLTRRPKKVSTPVAPIAASETKTETTTTDTSNTSGTVKCSNCGYENPKENEFCGKCGTTISK